MNKCKICKAILIGEVGVGKTSIINRFVNNEFNAEEISTKGASYDTVDLNYEEYKTTLTYQLWDTAGQEKYRGLAKIFYKDADIVVLVYDITRKQTYDELKNYWYKEINENLGDKISKLFKYI